MPKQELANEDKQVPKPQEVPLEDGSDDAWDIPAFLRQRN
jgi:hypothetical protein